ncbi:MAG: aldo/keto reductase [Acidimicrobiia bacterium]|nr:aldo/keto reductase [bacterium]MXX01074.1 aldo/keto reductase [Acidimicrobiia bacterium]MDE0673572.1 aldo/keto reductase [bacterium]MXY74856.1 aldo/keto reductase [Acidimicrobiia bacterium]MYA38970.1 aldo/keto reductase [Acidimicrobiia bacterium]
MRTGVIGSLQVSKVGLGCNNFGARLDKSQTEAVVLAALEHGITYFDTADIYGNKGLSEEYLGAALRNRRHRAVVGTKFGMEMLNDAQMGGSVRWVAVAVEDSLRRLGTDYIDLYQMHKPDPSAPIEETLGALHRLVEQGKVREIGCSNFTGDQVDQAAAVSRQSGFPRFVSAQNHYSLLARGVERELVPACARNGLSVMPYCPLANGVLTGKYQRGKEPPTGSRMDWVRNDPNTTDRGFMSDRNLDIVDGLREYAADHGRTLTELAISWLAAQPEVSTVIPGASSPSQVLANSRGADWAMTDRELDEIGTITGG